MLFPFILLMLELDLILTITLNSSTLGSVLIFLVIAAQNLIRFKHVEKQTLNI